MPIDVACHCGKSYSKPERKAGTRFRCHLCGRELIIPQPAPEEAIEVRPQPGQAPIKPTPWETDAMTDDDRSPRAAARPSRLRLVVAWGLIALGLTAVVGAIGQIYITSMIEKIAVEDAKAKGRMYGDFQPSRKGPNPEARTAYFMAAWAVGIGLVLCYSGYRVRKVKEARRGAQTAAFQEKAA